MTHDDAGPSVASAGSHAQLRERFAAAALTGLLSNSLRPEQLMSKYARMAAAYADAMLRELERTNHDAVPAATAQAEQATKSSPTDNARATAGCGSDRTDKPAPRPATGAGNTQEPAAWLAFATDGSESSAVYMIQEQAQAAADDWGWSVAPLYVRPTTGDAK